MSSAMSRLRAQEARGVVQRVSSDEESPPAKRSRGRGARGRGRGKGVKELMGMVEKQRGGGSG